MGSHRIVAFLTGIAAFAILPLACGDASSDTSSTEGAGGNAAGGNASSGGSGGGLSNPSCEPSCIAPQLCSVVGECIDDGTCKGDGDCGFGEECNLETEQCLGCNPPNLLISLDRSCSMTSQVGGVTKWELAVQAINAMTTQFAGQIRFGLALFPDRVTPQCQQDAIAIPVGDDNETPIQTLLTDALMQGDPNFPDGPCVTNIDTALDQAAGEPALDDTERASFVLLITDGKQANCSGNGGDAHTTQVITDLFTQRNVPTYVLGFGNGVDPAQLNVFANAGGVPTNDMSCNPPCNFYKAEDGASLQAALETIAGQIGCDPDIN